MKRWFLPLLFLLPACFHPLDPCKSANAGDALQCPMPGEVDRAFDLFVPVEWNGMDALPLIYAFHGGGGNRSNAARVTCPDGDSDNPDCLVHKANAAGYAVVLPDGSGNRPLRNIRTWNAGGGTDGWQCVSGGACRGGVDDMRFFDKLHEEIETLLPIDQSRVYATGLSNGGAISHRLACERANTFAAIAPVGGNNQYAAAGGSCLGGVAVLQIHGTEDPCWPYETGFSTCIKKNRGRMVGVQESLEGWTQRNGCSADSETEAVPDQVNDGTSTSRVRWQDCTSAAVELLRIEGGGHTWPQGQSYFGVDRIGLVAQDFDADDLILEFFDAHSK